MFQRKFKIELEHRDKTAISLVAFELLIGLAWVSKGVSGAELSAQSLWLPLSFPPLFPFFPLCSYLLSLTICNDDELHFPLLEART